jgi:hypothetical protein
LFRFFGLFTVQAFKNGWPDPLLREKLRQPLTLLGSENGPFEQKLLDNLLLLRILQEYGKGDGFIYRVDRPLLTEYCRSRLTQSTHSSRLEPAKSSQSA